MLQVMISVAIVMPEIGFDELPMSPVMRDDTVTKKKPKTTIEDGGEEVPLHRHAGRDGQEQREEQRARRARSTSACRARCAAVPPGPAAAPKSFTLSRNEAMMVGSVRASVIRPAASTAPAPV